MRHLELELFGSSLSGRVLWLTVGIILAVELVVLTPSLGNERQRWMWQRISLAHITALSAAAPQNGGLGPAAYQQLAQLSGIESIKLTQPDGAVLQVLPPPPLPPARVVYLADETLLHSTWCALKRIAGLESAPVGVVAPSPLQGNIRIEIQINGAGLNQDLRGYASHLAVLSAVVALVTGLLVFAALNRLLVRPLRVMTDNISGFRNDPEHAGQGELSALASRGDDEIAEAARELKTMLETMRAALWRNARLAALGTSVTKISHDLRNILSSALLVSSNLQESTDPGTQRAVRTLVLAMERAVQLVSRTVDFAREGPPAIVRTPTPLREVVDEAILVVCPGGAGITIENHVPAGLILPLDRMHIYRVLLNLLRNAAEAGAKAAVVTAETGPGANKIIVTDYGPGLPPRVQQNLFKPFAGSGRQGSSGLGLVIARDLMRAQGGELTLMQTGPLGTIFVLELSGTDTPALAIPLAQPAHNPTSPIEIF
jgi:signal transduction histidine kinase